MPGVGERPARQLSRQALAAVVEPRYEELLNLVQSELKHSGYLELLGAGVVLTGGSSKMEGVVELAEEVFHMPVRLGLPQYVKGLSEVVRNPIYATGVGLLIYGLMNGRENSRIRSGEEGLWARIKRWMGQF